MHFAGRVFICKNSSMDAFYCKRYAENIQQLPVISHKSWNKTKFRNQFRKQMQDKETLSVMYLCFRLHYKFECRLHQSVYNKNLTCPRSLSYLYSLKTFKVQLSSIYATRMNFSDWNKMKRKTMWPNIFLSAELRPNR